MAGDGIHLGLEAFRSDGRCRVAAVLGEGPDRRRRGWLSQKQVQSELVSILMSTTPGWLWPNDDHTWTKNYVEIGNRMGWAGVCRLTVAGNGSGPAASRPPRRLRAELASTDGAWLGPKPGSLSVRRSIRRGDSAIATNMRGIRAIKRVTAICEDFIPALMERLRRSAEGGAEGPGAASGLVIRKTSH